MKKIFRFNELDVEIQEEITLDVPYDYDKVMFFDEDNRYLITYYYISRRNSKSVFERK
jgi:hypothetical protein